MIARGQLVGVLACGPKQDGETPAPDERAVLATLAQAAGIAFDTLRTNALRSAVDRALEQDDLGVLRRAQAAFQRSPAP
ncbi:MAG: hypothetical protein GIX03_16425 [Candidatus Eremiobacteraeota bacterium]|nr:hypothetical protein [Candidatus Eremiobacteraeota bacterium]MBC5804545.1 hypothetical protein [Candidatus Eremiobacteraeota bacterium]MBC5824590.1 hypothetical protein [Candidatus Eremiobacteraeota bacterium]